MKHDNVLKDWIDGRSDEELMSAFDKSLVRDEIALICKLADEFEKRRLSV